jgi:hypothetical protein
MTIASQQLEMWPVLYQHVLVEIISQITPRCMTHRLWNTLYKYDTKYKRTACFAARSSGDECAHLGFKTLNKILLGLCNNLSLLQVLGTT